MRAIICDRCGERCERNYVSYFTNHEVVLCAFDLCGKCHEWLQRELLEKSDKEKEEKK